MKGIHNDGLLRACAGAGVWLCTVQAVWAHTQTLEPVVVSAARFEQRLSQTVPHTTVWTRADIERAQVADVLSLIEHAAGLEIARLGGVGAQSGVYLRGAETRQVLVLVDGVPLNNLNFSIAALDQLMLSQIERIEVVRGNVSSLYGSQAVGGVIQLFTRGATNTKTEAAVRVSAGSQATYQGAASIQGTQGDWRYALSASQFETEGASAIDPVVRPGTNPDRDGYDNRSASALMGVQWAPGHEVAVRGFRSHGRLQYDSEFGPATQADESTQTLESMQLMLSDQFTDDWRATLTSSRFRDDLDAAVTAFPYFVVSRSQQTSWAHEVALNEDWRATGAIEYLEQEIESDTQYARTGRVVRAARLGASGVHGAHQMQLNVRHDEYSDFGQAHTGYAGYGYVLTETVRVVASMSTAFNAPTFNDLFFPFGGNAALTPEKARSYEWGVRYHREGVQAGLNLFRTRYRDLIGNDAGFNRVNIGRARVQGGEMTLDVRMRPVRIEAAVTVQDARDLVSNTRLVRRARAFGHVQVSRSFGWGDLGLNWRWRGDRVDRAGGQWRHLGGYGLVDLTVRVALDRHWSLSARAANVLAHEYQTAWGYPGAVRAAHLALEAAF